MSRRHQGNKVRTWADSPWRTLRYPVGARFILASSPRLHRRRAFTLVELLIAIVVLLAVILALGRIFSTVTEVTSIGQASATILQEAAVIEQRLREDIANLSTDGIFAIRQVAIRNNVHGNDEPLLDPARPPDAVIRADQLLFFTDHVSTFQTVREGVSGLNTFPQANAARVYWGHAVQLPDGPRFERNKSGNAEGDAIDPDLGPEPLVPWRQGAMNMVETTIARAVNNCQSGFDVYSRSSGGEIDGSQPPPQQWLLSRQAVLLADSSNAAHPRDSNCTTRFGAGGGGPSEPSPFSVPTARSIFSDVAYGNNGHPRYGWSREIRNGRVDGAATTLSEIRRWLGMYNVSANVIAPRPWTDFNDEVPLDQGDDQRAIIAREMLYYPRGERRAPSMSRTDQALTNHIIGSAVSDFIVEWTWEDGTGDLYDESGNVLRDNDGNPLGFYTNYFDPNLSGNQMYEFQPEQPWFGINRSDDFCPDCPDRGVGFYGEIPFHSNSSDPWPYQVRANYKPADTLFPNLGWDDPNDAPNTIERWRTGTNLDWPFSAYAEGVWIYEAFFGYNRDAPVEDTPQGLQNITADMIQPELGYTPWPSAIRVTMTLHDPQGKLEGGREVQFVIELPKRER